MHEPKVKELINKGWSVEATTAFDEEGVDAWRWTSPCGKEVVVLGTHQESPPLPNEEELTAASDSCNNKICFHGSLVGHAGIGKSFSVNNSNHNQGNLPKSFSEK
jgi:hypothetical protein